LKKLSIETRETPPGWALLQRHLFVILNHAAEEFVERYTRADGTLVWRTDWPGMDGSDDPYEGFMNLALLYVLGGRDENYELARKMWDAITWQWTEYGQIYREFDAYYDWMHHGEGYLYLYFLGLADPTSLEDKQRAVRFAQLYTGDDAEAQNYDKDKKLIRSPITGSRGPRFEMTAEDWVTHRAILDNYLPPFEDIPGVHFPSTTCPWSDDTVYSAIIKRINARMAKGDVPLNLNATSLMAHTYMYTQDETFKTWALDYLETWKTYTEQNGGITPDNIGLSGVMGEYNDGKWWGGYYGWRWPHGFLTIIEPILNAVSNAVLLTGDLRHLEFARAQLDNNWQLRKEHAGQTLVPYRHFDSGWSDYRPVNLTWPIQLWMMSNDPQDLERVYRYGETEHWQDVISPAYAGGNTKHFIANTLAWFQYIQGKNPTYPTQILQANLELIQKQLAFIRSEEGDPKNFDLDDAMSIHRWQELTPIILEGLVQLTLGAPMHLSHGGLQHGRLRYFDAKHRRPGLPEDVAVCVESLDYETVTVSVMNLHSSENRDLIIQAGTFAEHHFREVDVLNENGQISQSLTVDDSYFLVELKAASGTRLRLSQQRYVQQPSYRSPWHQPEHVTLLRGRKV
jgi:hypothetical protein